MYSNNASILSHLGYLYVYPTISMGCSDSGCPYLGSLGRATTNKIVSACCSNAQGAKVSVGTVTGIITIVNEP
jgi:hypothetical protein